MNSKSPMNDDELLAAVRGSLAAARDSLDAVRMERPVEALIATARARRARRVLAVRAAVACGAAAAAVAGVLAVTGARGVTPARESASAAQARTTAYVIGRVRDAVAQNNMVVQALYTFSPAFPAIAQWSYRGHFSMMQSGLMHVPGVPWAQGQVSFGAGTATHNGKLTYVQVDYRHHEWYPTPQQGFMPSQCSAGLDIVEFAGAPVDWPTYIQRALSCRLFKVAGHALVDGQETIKVTGSMTERHSPPYTTMRTDAVLYVNRSTYMPVRVTWSNLTRAADGKALLGTIREDVRLLPPTARNIARASIPIPAGFRNVPGDPFGGPVFQLAP